MALKSRGLLLGAAAGRLQAAGEGLRFTSAVANLRTTEGEVDTKENEVVAPDFTNRNPRNLELLALARKERGWETTWPKREYWHRLRLERTQRYVEAFVEHCSGNVVVSASTREWAIKSQLYSPKGVAACENIGRVVAQRCLEAGINFVNFKAVIPWEYRCDSIQRFQKALTDGGVVVASLEESINKMETGKISYKGMSNNCSHTGVDTEAIQVPNSDNVEHSILS